MTEIECPKCKCINNRTIYGDFGPHKAKIVCVECDSFIQWAATPVEHDWKFTFGKYEGKEFGDVLEADPDYLVWLAGQDWVKEKFPRLFAAIEAEGI